MFKAYRFALGVLLIASGGFKSSAAERMPVMYTPSAPNMVSWVAKDQGLFAKHGLDVDFVLASNGSVIIAAIQSGSVQVGTPSPTVFLQAVDNGLDQVAIAATNQYPDPTPVGLVARSDAHIAAAKDLIGKKVGVPGVGGFLDVILRKWLADNGVDTSKVNFVEVPLPQTGDALRAHQADAVASVAPFLSRAVDSGAGVFVANYTETLPEGTIASVYTVSKAWADAHAAATKAFQQGLLDALAYIKSGEHDASVRESIARYTTLPKEVVKNLKLPNAAVGLSAAQVQFWIDLAQRQGLTSNPIDAASIIMALPKS